MASLTLEGCTARQGDETLGYRSRSPVSLSRSSPQGLTHYTDQKPARSVLPRGSCGRRADFPECGRELQAGWFSWNVFTTLNGTWSRKLDAAAVTSVPAYSKERYKWCWAWRVHLVLWTNPEYMQAGGQGTPSWVLQFFLTELALLSLEPDIYMQCFYLQA